MLDIAKGLHYLHSLRIIHHDVKSANILLTKELTAKISDVGLSRALSSLSYHSVNDSADPPGTLAYVRAPLPCSHLCMGSVAWLPRNCMCRSCQLLITTLTDELQFPACRSWRRSS
jgi:serine/threonine protein kinase